MTSDDGLDDLRELAAAMNARITAVEGPPIDPSALLATGEWSYKDLPWMHSMLFDAFLGVFGEGEHHLLARTNRGQNSRGQVLVSSAARENVGARQADLTRLMETLEDPQTHAAPATPV